jgi:methylated-DNA-protein-cysteine methyltransferase related protein
MTRTVKEEQSFASRVLDCVAAIPPGRVMSYGGVAAAIGSRAPRAVGHVLARSERPVPWHRVVRSDGALGSPQRDRQLRLLLAEGVPIEDDRVIMEWAVWSVPSTPGTGRQLSKFQGAAETGVHAGQGPDRSRWSSPGEGPRG